MKNLLIALIALAPVSVQAQAWATREVCSVSLPVEIAPSVLTAEEIETLRKEALLMANPVGRFWRIQSPDGAVSHLWGTLHSSDPLILDLPDLVKKRIHSARLVALENDPVLPSRQAVSERAQYNPFRPASSTFKFEDTGLAAWTVDWIRSRLDGLGWGRDAADYLTLGAVAEYMLSDPCNDYSAGILPIQDDFIQTLGLIGNAEILGLEPSNALRTALDQPQQLNTARAILAVYGAYLQPRSSSALRSAEFALYLQGETALSRGLDRRFLQGIYGKSAADGLLKVVDGYLIDDRNHAFLQAVLPHLKDGGVFMAIGAFHLPGEQGMIELIRAAGYTVTRIPLPGETGSPTTGVQTE